MSLPEPGKRLDTPLEDVDKLALREAADWFTRLQSGDATDTQRRQWHLWLARTPANTRAWEWMQFVSGRLYGLNSPAGAVLAKSRSRRRTMNKTLAVLLGLGATGAATQDLLPWRAWRATHHASVGQVRRIALDDGSTLWLDTDSAIDTDFSPTRRQIELVQGRIFIQTAPDSAMPPRPFEVVTAHGVMQPLGTRFAVKLAAQHTELAVYEGMVAGRLPEAPDSSAVHIAADWRVRLTPTGIDTPRPAGRAMQAWTEGILMAEHIRLADFVAELGRYRRGWTHCAPEVADLLLFGSYPLSDIDGSLDAIARTLPVRIERRWPGRISVEPA